MAYLGDYLGQLLAELSMARMQADLETVRLAEIYAAHPLLRTMPVPHVRMPEVELEIPALIKATEEPRKGESARGGVTVDAVSKKFAQVLDAQLAKAGVVLTDANRTTLRAALDSRLAASGPPTEVAVDVHRLADDLTSTALRVVADLPRGPEHTAVIPPNLAEELKTTARVEFLRLRTPPPRLSVLVTSAEIREGGTSENVTRMRLKVSEQGVEWVTIDSDGTSRDRLVPE